MEQITTIGVDLAKQSFQLICKVSGHSRTALRL